MALPPPFRRRMHAERSRRKSDRSALRRWGEWLRGRSVAEWAVRLLLASVVAVCGYYAAAHSLAWTLRKAAPTRAYAIAKYDGRLAAAVAQRLLEPNASSSARARARALGEEALLKDPTAVGGASTLGLVAQLRGDDASARRLFRYSERLSRRDLTTQLWAIEAAVARNDIPGALKYYDSALRTSRVAPDLLFPVLGAAIADPPIRFELVRTMARRPAWNDRFISYVSGNGPDAVATADLFLRLERAGIPIFEGARAAAVNALFNGGFIDDAWSFYAAGRSGADRRESRDPEFEAGVDRASIFDWEPLSDAGINTSMQSGSLSFSASTSVGGALLRQVQLLPPGMYRLHGRSVGIEQRPDATPYWVLDCHDGRQLGRVSLPPSGPNEARFAGVFRVPKGCPVQTLTLVARPSDEVGGLSGQVIEARLVPIR